MKKTILTILLVLIIVCTPIFGILLGRYLKASDNENLVICLSGALLVFGCFLGIIALNEK